MTASEGVRDSSLGVGGPKETVGERTEFDRELEERKGSGGDAPNSSRLSRGPRLTIPTRILLATLSLSLAFFLGSTTSVVAHQRSAETLRLLHEGYLPLALTLGAAKADHAVYGSMLARMLTEPDPSRTAEWVERAVRQVMPATIDAALAQLERARALEPEGEDALLLVEIAHLLVEVRDGYADTTYLEAYLHALRHGQRIEAQAALDALRRRDRRLSYDLRRAVEQVQRRVASISAVTAAEQRRATWVAGGMTLLGLLFGLAVSIWARRLLAPLPRLEARVLEVARGDLEPPEHGLVRPGRLDEIGRLAVELERMVQALRARDRALREATERAIRSEQLAAMGRMAAHVTHEVRNPLTSIHLNTELLEEEIAMRGEGHDEIAKLLRAIRREVDRLVEITEEYLRLARLPSPKLEPEDLGALTREVLEFSRRELEAANVRIELDVTPGLPLVSVDEAQVRQALLNVVRNGREAMPDGGTLRVRVEREGEAVLVRIADEGRGVPEEVRAKMFDAFFSTKERGTGLGLALTQQIVLAHRGSIRCENRDGKGAEFVLAFPIATTDPTLP